MTTTTSSSATHGGTPASAAQGSSASARANGRPAGGTPGNADLFANLLSLLSAGTDPAADTTALTPDVRPDALPGDDTEARADAAQNPLAALLGWPGAPTPLLPSGTDAAARPDANAATVAAGVLPNNVASAADARPQPGAHTTPADATAAGTTLPSDLPTLASPEPLDADTLAALGQNPPSTTPHAAPAGGTLRPSGDARLPLGARVTAWRSTTTLAHTAGAAMAGHPAQPGRPGADAPALAAQVEGVRASARLDDRLALAPGATERDNEQDGSTTISGAGGAHGAVLTAAGGQADLAGGAGQDASPDLQPGQTTPGDDANAADAAAQAAAEADEAASGGWSAQHLRHASVRLGEPGEQAIDIQLSMAGQEVRVEFRTDDAQTRASLAQDGGAALGDLLQRSGIELGGVSVGAQGQQAGQDQPPARAPRSQAGSAPQRADSATGTADNLAPPPRPRADGSRPLDLFV